MLKRYNAFVWKEDDWYIAQCVEIDIASHGHSTEEALLNLKEALELHFTPPIATITPSAYTLEVEAPV